MSESKIDEVKKELHELTGTIKWLEGKASGLMLLFGKISEDADEVIDKHYTRVTEKIDEAYKKIQELTKEIEDYERDNQG